MSFLEITKQAGVIGAGGAGFPTYAKLNCQADVVLINGAECEPLLRTDQMLMARYPEELLLGAKCAAEQTGAPRAIIGIKNKHRALIAQLERCIDTLQVGAFVSVGILPDIYPAGDEMVLVYQLTGRIVPEAGLPKQVGCVVINAETCINLFRAAQGIPVTEKYITVTGDVPQPKLVCVPVGTPAAEVFRLCGVEDLGDFRVIRGGPMMGSLLDDLQDGITKKDKGFIVLKKGHPLVRKKSCTEEQARRINRSACEQCRMCTDLCPRFLLGHHMEPHKMMRTLSYAPEDASLQTMAALCSQCNLCSAFACPANLYPSLTNMMFKKNLARENRRYLPDTQSCEARPSRSYRMVPSKRLIARLGLAEFDRPAVWAEKLPIPREVRIAARQCVGAAARPIVHVGQYVHKGDVIGQVGQDELGTPIHASINGVVAAWDETCIVIKREE